MCDLRSSTVIDRRYRLNSLATELTRHWYPMGQSVRLTQSAEVWGDHMCPVCGEPMAVFEFEGIGVDRCVRCGGTWMDTGEVEMLGAFDLAALDRISATLAAAPEVRRTRPPLSPLPQGG